MVKRDKRIERWRQNPMNVRFIEVDAVLLNLGFHKRQRGSHAVYTFESYELTVPLKLPFILPVYVRRVLAVLDMMRIDEGEE